jgi:hypothetical protein
METPGYVCWQDGNWLLGYLRDYPDYRTQGETLDDLMDHLADLRKDLSEGLVPGVTPGGCPRTSWPPYPTGPTPAG